MGGLNVLLRCNYDTKHLHDLPVFYKKIHIPSRLLKIAGNIIAPSLTQIFITKINTGIFPTEWKLARVTPIFKNWQKGRPEQLSTNIHYSDRCQKFRKKYIRPAL